MNMNGQWNVYFENHAGTRFGTGAIEVSDYTKVFGSDSDYMYKGVVDYDSDGHCIAKIRITNHSGNKNSVLGKIESKLLELTGRVDLEAGRFRVSNNEIVIVGKLMR